LMGGRQQSASRVNMEVTPVIIKASHVLTVLGSLFASVTEANALITVMRCEIRGIEKPMFITEYSDGSPARVGTAAGTGNRADVFRDPRSQAFVVVELNTDFLPDTLTTVQADGRAVHSRHAINVEGKIVAPSQAWGMCTKRELL
jgi:hypothetical protein